MTIKISILRKAKALFLKFRLHMLIEPLSGFFLDVLYLSKLSQWAEGNKGLQYNDFYAEGWNYEKRYDLYKYVVERESLGKPITYLEFGVSDGHSFRWWSENVKNPKSRFYGFDTFTGLPEDWGGFKKGEMSTDSKVPATKDRRVKFIKGLFQETLPAFLKTARMHGRKVIHLDADLYSSTLYVLTTLAPFLRPGDILFFDEFAVPRHEFLAFRNFVESHYVKFELIGAANNYLFVAFKVEGQQERSEARTRRPKR